MGVKEIFEQIDSITGWFSKEDVKSFSKIKLPKNPTIVELGTFCGRSTAALRLLFPDAQIITCDPVLFDDPSLMKEHEFIYINCSGLELHWKLPIDLLFIDDSHEYETVKADIEKYKPLIKKGGYIVCHDYYDTGVEDAVEELLPDAKIIKTGDFSQAIWKK